MATTKHIRQDYKNPVSLGTRSLRCMIGYKSDKYTLSVQTFEEVYSVLRTNDRSEALAHWARCEERLQSDGFVADGPRTETSKVR